MRIRQFLSSQFNLENGLPQDTVLAVVLFLLVINDIFNCISRPAIGAWFADDGVVMIKGKNIQTCTEIIQDSLNSLIKWCESSGFKFSSIKTEFMIFTRSNKIRSTLLDIYLGKDIIRMVDFIKILGLTFDSRLKRNIHIKELKNDCKRRINIIKTLSSIK